MYLIRKIIPKKIKFFQKLNYKLNILIIIFGFSCSMLFPQHSLAYGQEKQPIRSLQGIIIKDVLSVLLNPDINNLQLSQNRLPEIKDRELNNHRYRYVTAYNVGVVAQTDNTPCIGASGDDLCQLVDQGINVCAANFVRLGTYLEIEDVGKCIVLDRMNVRYTSRVDIAMGADEIAKAKEFGLKKLKVGIY